MLQCNFFNFFFFRPNDSRMLVALGESYEKLAQQVEAKKVQSNSESTSISYVCVCPCPCAGVGVCVRVFWPALCLCSVTGGPTRWGTWRKWLCSNWQSEWLCQSSLDIQLDLDCSRKSQYLNIIFWLFFFFQLLKGYMSNWTSPMTLPSPTCSTSKTFIHAGWVTDRWHLT